MRRDQSRTPRRRTATTVHVTVAHPTVEDVQRSIERFVGADKALYGALCRDVPLTVDTALLARELTQRLPPGTYTIPPTLAAEYAALVYLRTCGFVSPTCSIFAEIADEIARRCRSRR